MKIYFAFDNDSIENKLMDTLSTNHKCVGVFKGSVDTLYETLLSIDYELLVLRESVFKESDSLKVLQKLVSARPNIRIVYVVKDRTLGDEYLFECAKLGIYDILNGLINIKSIIRLIATKNEINDLDYYLTPSQINELMVRKSDKNVPCDSAYKVEKEDLSFGLLDECIEFEIECNNSETPILDKIKFDNQESRKAKRNELDNLFELKNDFGVVQHEAQLEVENPQEKKAVDHKGALEKDTKNSYKYPIILYCVAHPLTSHVAQSIAEQMKALCIDTDFYNAGYDNKDHVVYCKIDLLCEKRKLIIDRKCPVLLNINLNQTSIEVLNLLLSLTDRVYLEIIQNDPAYKILMERYDCMKQEGLMDKVICAYYEDELESADDLQKRTGLVPILIQNSRKSENLSRNSVEFEDCIDTKRLLKEMME